jgi:hypothetical protein
MSRETGSRYPNRAYSGMPAPRNAAKYSFQKSVFMNALRARSLASIGCGSKARTSRATWAASLCRPCLTRHTAWNHPASADKAILIGIGDERGRYITKLKQVAVAPVDLHALLDQSAFDTM